MGSISWLILVGGFKLKGIRANSPILVNENPEKFSFDFETKKVYEDLKTKVVRLLDSRKSDLELAEIDPVPEFS